MKKSFYIIAWLVLLSIVLASICAGCDLTRKLGGAEMTFPGKVSGAKSLSFKMRVLYKKGDSQTVIDMDCYKTTDASGVEEYAYVSSCSESQYLSYKNIYADHKLYEVANVTKGMGTYYVRENIEVNDQGNILYHVTKNILLTSAASLLSKSQKETLNGETVYRYDIEIGGKNVSIWYNKKVLVQLYVAFEGENGEEGESYLIGLSDYAFDGTIASDIFERPAFPYVESPISLDSWMDILYSFAGKLGV